MSILKQKIKACQRAHEKMKKLSKKKSSDIEVKIEHTESTQSEYSTQSQPKKRKRLKGDCYTPRCYLQAKNIVTNFGKAMATFAMGDLSTPYLVKELEIKGFTHLISPLEFKEFVRSSKGTINSIDSLRNLLLVEENDSEKIIACKKCFQTLAEIFIKCFSVNWICSGRVTYKLEHLKFRHRMLRRIKNPEIFTYLKGYDDKKKKKNKKQ